MKRKTFVRYFGVLSVSLAIMAFASLCTVVEMLLASWQSNVPVQADTDKKCNVTVIIDPGHGGEDGGAVGTSLGLVEKDINLAISIELKALFELTDINAVMTRSEDVLLYDDALQAGKKTQDLNNRLKFALQYESPVFVSVHQNKFPVEKYKGLQVYYSKNNADSQVLAGIIQDKTVSTLQKENNRKIKQAGRNIFLLHRLECPAVLVECGFLSNKEEEALLGDTVYRKKLAFVLFSSVMDYLNTCGGNDENL